MNIPVAFIIFNRPDLTMRVFEVIRKVKPLRLYIIADGPRKEAEKLITDDTRKVTEQIDWECEVFREYSEVNLGCKNRVITGLNAVFEKEERAIILEDDCLPNPDFFKFAVEMFEKYGHDKRIGTICGTSMPLFSNHFATKTDYTFTSLCIIWGWATTRKVWQLVDPMINQWENLKKTNWLKKQYPGQPELAHAASRMFFHTRKGVDAWSYALFFALLSNNLLNIHPAANLISNIGFDERAAHTHHKMSYSDLPLQSFNWPLKHPVQVERDRVADDVIYKNLYHWNFRKLGLGEKLKSVLILIINRFKLKLNAGLVPKTKFKVVAREK